jgi:hypothetical protein
MHVSTVPSIRFDQLVSSASIGRKEQRNHSLFYSKHVEFTRVAMMLRNSPAGFMAALYDIFRGELSGNMAI